MRPSGADFIPRARYAHLSAVSGSRLYIIGGQDLQNAWLDDVCVYDMHTRRWTVRRDYPRHAGTYRSVAVAAHLRVRDPAREAEARTATASSEKAGAALGPPGGRFALERRPSSAKGEYTPSENLIHLPYSADATDDFPNDIYLYSNYNVSGTLSIEKSFISDDGYFTVYRCETGTGSFLSTAWDERFSVERTLCPDDRQCAPSRFAFSIWCYLRDTSYFCRYLSSTLLSILLHMGS